MQVRAFAVEKVVAAHRQEHVEVARRAAARAGLALAREADARAVLDARRDVDLQRLVSAHAALARADLARLVDDLSRAMAGVAGALDGEEALLRAQPSAALAGRALLRLGAGFRARAMAGLAGDRAGHAHGGVGAGKGLFEGDLEIEPKVLAAHVAAPAGPPASAAAEHVLEDVAEHGAEIETLRAVEAAGAGARAHAAVEGGRSVAVIGRALVGILQDVVGVIEFLELLLGVLVAGIAIGVILHRELAIRLLQVVRARRPAASQLLVKVLRHVVYAAPAAPL